MDAKKYHSLRKHMSLLWCFMAFLIITMDVLSLVSVVRGGYAFPLLAFLYFTLSSAVSTFRGCPVALFVIMNIMIIAILLSSGFFLSSSGYREEDVLLLPHATCHREERKVSKTKARPAPRKAKSQRKAAPVVEVCSSSSLIIMEIEESTTENDHLMTCDQDVFNEIIGNYIDKFKQDIRQQEMAY